MDSQIYIEEGGKMVMRRRQNFLRRLLFWVGLQVCWGGGILAFELAVHPHPFWMLEAVQWVGVFVLFYGQIYTAQIRGMDSVFGPPAFDRWDVIKSTISDMRFLVFKKSIWEDGTVVCRVYPFFPSRKYWRTITKLSVVRILIGLKLIR